MRETAYVSQRCESFYFHVFFLLFLFLLQVNLLLHSCDNSVIAWVLDNSCGAAGVLVGAQQW